MLDRVEAFLDDHGLGAGPLRATRIGDGGGSNFSFLLERGDARYVLRRPPRPPLPPSAHDMVREARLQLALAPQGIRLPPIVAVCEDESVLGLPFYVMRFLDGHVVTDRLPPGLEEPAARGRLGEELIDAMVEIHAADVSEPALAAFAGRGSYLERQVRRFAQLWEINATREIPTVVEVGPAARRRAARPAAGHRRPRRLPAREPHGRARPPGPRSGGARLGDGRDRRPARRPRLPPRHVQPSRVAARARSASLRSPRSRASRRRRSSSRATSSGAGGRSGRSAGSRRSRSGRPRSSARRSTGASCGASSAPRTPARPGSRRASR